MKITYKLLTVLYKKHILWTLAIIVLSNFQIIAQTNSLGWTGNEIIAINEFTDSASWVINSNESLGDSCYVTTDDSCTYIHWKFGAGNRSKYTQCYLDFSTPLLLSDIDVFGFDIRGSENNGNRNIQLKFEDGVYQAPFRWENLAGLPRWCERISVLKNQFENSNLMNWNSIRVVSFEVCSDASENDTQPDSGIVVLKNFMGESLTDWERATSYEELKNSNSLETIKDETINAILNRQNPNTGLFYTWQETNSTYLYGQGLVLKMLSLEGEWENSQPINPCAQAAEKLALFLINNQDNQGFWPRAWNTETGEIIQFVENNNTIWMGDFPWIITGLQNYYKKSCDNRVKIAINKAKQFLYNLIESNGELNTINPFNQEKAEVTSSEAYAATILSLLELNDTITSNLMLKYINDLTWDNELSYWKEAIGSSRVVLFANTWLSDLVKHTSDSVKALEALSLVGNILSTKGPGGPPGLDGVGPVATWYEGTLSYICAKGPGSQFLFDSISQYILPDGTVPHYNDSTGSVAGIWSVEWSSLDGTAWLYFAASKQSPFDVSLSENCNDEENKKVYMHYMGWFNDSIDDTDDEILRHWNCGTTHIPKIGKYDSKSWPLLTYHMLLSHSCGIDGLIINEKDEYDHKCTKSLQSTIERIQNIDAENFQYEFAISYDDQGMDTSYPFDTASTKFSYLRDNILNESNNYIHYYNRPALFIFNYDNYLSAQDYQSLVNDEFSINKPLIIWNEIRESEIEYIDASYPWVQPAPYDAWDEESGLNWGKDYLNFYYNEINSANITTKLDFACGAVWPGFNDTLNTCWGTDVDRWMDRRNNELYDSTWSFIHDYKETLPLRWLIIETWNDFNEGSEIEPSMENGYNYLVSTINNINEFKDSNISTSIRKFEVAEKIYFAADSIYKNIRDSASYYPTFERTIRYFLTGNYDASEQAADTIIYGITTNIDDSRLIDNQHIFITIHPNPATSIIQINFTLKEFSKIVLKLINTQGREVETLFSGSLSSGETIIVRDLSHLTKGIYFYSLTSNKYQIVNKLILQ